MACLEPQHSYLSSAYKGVVILRGSADWSLDPGMLILGYPFLCMCCFASDGSRGPCPWKVVLLRCLGKGWVSSGYRYSGLEFSCGSCSEAADPGRPLVNVPHTVGRRHTGFPSLRVSAWDNVFIGWGVCFSLVYFWRVFQIPYMWLRDELEQSSSFVNFEHSKRLSHHSYLSSFIWENH